MGPVDELTVALSSTANIQARPPRISLRRRQLTARLVQRKNRELTFEIAADEAFEWDPRRDAVWWLDRTKLTAVVVGPQTTGKGPVEPGVTVRLTVRLDMDGPEGPPSQLVVRSGDQILTITVGRA